METLSKIAAALKVGVTITNASQAYALLRGVLVALGTVFGLLGLAWLSPEKIAYLIQLAQAIGGLLAALSALVGGALVVLPPIIASFKASPQERTSDVGKAAQGGDDASKQVLIAATNAARDLAKSGDEDTKQALIAATIAQPSVQTIVTDAKTAAAAPSEDVVAAPAE